MTKKEKSDRLKKLPPLPYCYGNEKEIDTSGYLPLQTRIEGMLLAGEKLVSARDEMFDLVKEGVDVFAMERAEVVAMYEEDAASFDSRLRDHYENDMSVITQTQFELMESLREYEYGVAEVNRKQKEADARSYKEWQEWKEKQEKQDKKPPETPAVG